MTSSNVNLAVSELLRAADVCANSKSRAVRAAGLIHALRATGIVEGTIKPRVLTDAEARKIITLVSKSLAGTAA